MTKSRVDTLKLSGKLFSSFSFSIGSHNDGYSLNFLNFWTLSLKFSISQNYSFNSLSIFLMIFCKFYKFRNFGEETWETIKRVKNWEDQHIKKRELRVKIYKSCQFFQIFSIFQLSQKKLSLISLSLSLQ